MATQIINVKKDRLFFVNIGQGVHRCWADCFDFGFIAAGQHPKWSNQLYGLYPEDIIIAYLKKHGYVGIGRVIKQAVPINDFNFTLNGQSLKEVFLNVPNIYDNAGTINSEFILEVNWLKKVSSYEAKWLPKSGLYTPQHIKASLLNQPTTVRFIEKEFDVQFEPPPF